ncbi:hypothetical protein [Actinoplanes sp. M2I2]|uniref:hypothetical protein n=1 Tax=Actinoplanes sp. M2I2 TaxID=1734444 RepID=UPI00201FC409|nr:hypothetical protein [Actinoplanes sp. M2I2]
MITVQEFARRLSTLGAETYTDSDVVDLATDADVRLNSDLGVDAGLAQRLLDHLAPASPVTGPEIVATEWPPPTSSHPAAPPVVFSSPGAVDNNEDPPGRPRSAGRGRPGRRPDSRRSGR